MHVLGLMPAVLEDDDSDVEDADTGSWFSQSPLLLMRDDASFLLPLSVLFDMRVVLYCTRLPIPAGNLSSLIMAEEEDIDGKVIVEFQFVGCGGIATCGGLVPACKGVRSVCLPLGGGADVMLTVDGMGG